MKRIIALCVALLMVAGVMAGCNEAPATASTAPGASTPPANSPAGEPGAAFDAANDIMVVSREDGSGTRGAFVELVGVEEDDASGEAVDRTTVEANITNSTAVMMTTVAGNPYAIGYISLGSMNDSIKALEIDGVTPSADTVKDGSYAISRPFNIVTTGTVNETTQDFINFILSAEGQAVVEGEGYIAVAADAPAYESTGASGSIVVAGSSSVTPVMEKLQEAYLALNAGVTIEVQQSDSSTGITNTIDGICDIGMASREVRDTELEQGVTPTVIAQDGIAVIVNNQNTLAGLTTEQVKSIFVGDVLSWDEVVA